jgi:hypothetical protein
MPCILAVLALFVPRVVIVAVWFFSNWFEAIFDTILWPVLGFVFLPTTLLWYSVVVHVYGGEWSILPVVGIVISLLIDLSPAAGRNR